MLSTFLTIWKVKLLYSQITLWSITIISRILKKKNAAYEDYWITQNHGISRL